MKYGTISIIGSGICMNCPCADLLFTPGGVHCEHEFACRRIIDKYQSDSDDNKEEPK